MFSVSGGAGVYVVRSLLVRPVFLLTISMGFLTWICIEVGRRVMVVHIRSYNGGLLPQGWPG